MKTLTILFAGLLFSLALPESLKAQIHVRSSAFASGGNIPAQFTCKGANTNPPLQFEGIPRGAKSLALIVDDPDAPSGLFTHWLIWNIDPATTQIAEKSVPHGAVEGTSDFGKPGYGGPCPPSGTHRYFFRLFALNQTLDLKMGVKRSALEHAMKGHVIGQGELMGRFSH
jgi:Raf kinase inhibitor-like YbhB/YbcL family protein